MGTSKYPIGVFRGSSASYHFKIFKIRLIILKNRDLSFQLKSNGVLRK